MKRVFLGILFYFVVSMPVGLILTSVFRMDATDDRWAIWLITLPVVLAVAAGWEVLKYWLKKHKEAPKTEN